MVLIGGVFFLWGVGRVEVFEVWGVDRVEVFEVWGVDRVEVFEVWGVDRVEVFEVCFWVSEFSFCVLPLVALAMVSERAGLVGVVPSLEVEAFFCFSFLGVISRFSTGLYRGQMGFRSIVFFVQSIVRKKTSST